MSRAPFACRCVLCHDYGDRDAADRADLGIIENVRRHGWHVVMVPEDEIGPGFAYTIGLSHTHGVPELALFGLDVHTMHRMLNALGDRAAAGAVPADGQEHEGIAEGRRVALRNVDLRWYRTFFGRAIRFYRRPPFPVLQVTWPDAQGRFHGEEGAGDEHRESQPQLWLPPDEHPAGVWTVEL
ncbi:DUF4262 domain-containing protein [Streptomyces sp. MMG1121]|uniref:DUF4262 domain-containing protein n=1 Tax=Streptomyces sp. MMG1121 TaxID=1415544 RepID=UPI0006AE6CDB|nr:DUF4262 domain-containing protein [Streptomyces sp. MMG1121]KOV63670.1 hypothetical protein ADK64_19070 [Streptomyces sp. MMG1121]